MFPAPFIAVVDANVLVNACVRDLVLRAAAADFFQLRWSEQILAEVERTLITKLDLPPPRASRVITAMAAHFPDARVIGHEPLIDAMPNDPKDRHLAAAAVKAGAQVIITFNLKDFAELPDDIEAQSPDEFLCNLFDLNPRGFVALIHQQARDLDKPPSTTDQLLDRLARYTPDVVALARHRLTIKKR